jgi:hypothetical protein
MGLEENSLLISGCLVCEKEDSMFFLQIETVKYCRIIGRKYFKMSEKTGNWPEMPDNGRKWLFLSENRVNGQKGEDKKSREGFGAPANRPSALS